MWDWTMAIQFARLQYVQRSKGQSSCQKAAYNGRTNIYDLRQDLNYDYSSRGDGVYHSVLLPEGVSEKFNNIADLWNTIESIEVRINSQVAKEMVLALPNETFVSLEDKIAMVHSFLDKHFVQHGLICQVDIHAPHSKEKGSRWQRDGGRDHNHDESDDCKNWHAHVLMPTRVCHDELFGEKARHLDVDVRQGRVVGTDKQWGYLWADHQNAYFKENDIDLVVDPIGIVPELYVKKRFKSQNLDDRKQESRQENMRKSRDERLVLQHLLSHDSTFERKDVDRFARKHVQEIDREDFLGRFWSSKELVLVKEDQYTSKTVLREEQKMIRMADRLARKTYAVEPNHEIDLSVAQQQVVNYVCAGPNLSCLEGRAGTDKSLVMSALREVHESRGMTVRGLAPRCSLANEMEQKDGFGYGALVQKFLFDHHHGKIEIECGKEVWIVDEATMVTNPDMGALLDKAWRYDAKVVLIGDENQVCLNGRSGAFKALTERFGSRSIESYVLQKDDAHGRIIEEIKTGEITDALFQKMENDTWRHHSTEQEAVRDLVNTWCAHYKNDPTDSFMILEQRDQYVKVLNNNIHKVLRQRGELGQEDIMVQTVQYGFEYFCTGDKIIFRSEDKDLGIDEGQAGVLVSVKKDEFVVRVNDDKDITFDPQHYNAIQHGYAVNSKNMNEPVDHVFALHAGHMDQNLFNHAHTQSRLSCHYFSYGDRERVFEDLSRQIEPSMSIDPIDSERRSWLGTLVMNIVDYFSKNHEFYKNPYIYYREQGLLITSHLEDSRLKGYRAIYKESQDAWPSLEGQNIRMTSQHRDLEPFLREQGVGQCILLDVNRQDSQLIGPYDRFHTFFQDHRSEFRGHDITETQLRVRLFALEQQHKEHPHHSADMTQSRAYAQLLHNETHIRPELMKTHDAHTTTQVLYHLEKTGEMPTGQDLHRIQQRVGAALEHFSTHQHDKIFAASLEREVQRQIQFEKQHQMQMER